MVCFSSSSPCSRVRSISSKHRYNNNIGTKGMTSINLLCQHIKFVIWYRLVFPIRCISRTANYNKNMMFPLLSYIYENISFRSHHVHSFSHAFCSITFPAHHFPAAGSRPVCHRFLRRADCRTFPAPSIRAHGFSACYRLWLAPACL